MPDGTSSGLIHLLDMAKYLWIAFVGLFVWQGKRVVNDVEDLKKASVSQDTFNSTLKSLRQDIKDIGKEVHTDINALHSRIDKLVDK